jgi:hypothetical protein
MTLTEKMAEYLLKSRKGDDKRMSDQEFLCKYVNEELGLKLPCRKVLRSL